MSAEETNYEGVSRNEAVIGDILTQIRIAKDLLAQGNYDGAQRAADHAWMSLPNSLRSKITRPSSAIEASAEEQIPEYLEEQRLLRQKGKRSGSGQIIQREAFLLQNDIVEKAVFDFSLQAITAIDGAGLYIDKEGSKIPIPTSEKKATEQPRNKKLSPELSRSA